MKLSKIAMLAAIACASYANSMSASANETFQLVGHCEEAGCDCSEPACGCEDACDAMCDDGCDSMCGSGLGLLDHNCCIGEPWSLFGDHCGWSAGGWVQMGYHSRANALFNSRPDEFQLHQAWLYAEKAIDTSCGFDIGGRIDYVYGTDGPDTQAFGTGTGWDNGWDNGNDYGSAIPQLYMEAGYGDLSVKVGHFYTIIGWEVVTAPDNFFYSHAYTMYNSEPFTHTGALFTYTPSDDVTVYGGYTLGWDSGFDDNGDSFLGGISLALTDNVSLTYATVAGRFGDSVGAGSGERGYMHSIVADVALSDNLQYIFQNDILSTEDAAGATVRETYGINQYLIYTVNDCLAYGGRFEWYDQEGVFDSEGEVTSLTAGLNYKPHANVLVRPEVRWDWDNTAGVDAGLEDGDDQTTFGIDTIFLF
ncbi:MAG: hypothetical protein CBB71_13675 [Rhodopirellula sp. TMED11]|nr:MAG: hypothetical protein CBB71_13675 [Rhodopirellula sp. TMED11]